MPVTDKGNKLLIISSLFMDLKNVKLWSKALQRARVYTQTKCGRIVEIYIRSFVLFVSQTC